MKVICLGDIVGRPGRSALRNGLAKLKAEYGADVVIANAENAAGGLGIDSKTGAEIKDSGVDVITLGDHAWQKKEAHSFIENQRAWVARPANYPAGSPGVGALQFKVAGGGELGVMNLMGRVFMGALIDCPFRRAEELLSTELKSCRIIILDMHAEATSEKEAIAKYLDGKVSLVFGTHTHVQTADERILAGGTAFITDLGMCGSMDGVIGMQKEAAIGRFVTGLPHSYDVAKGPGILQGVFCEIDDATGKALKITRIKHMPEEQAVV